MAKTNYHLKNGRHRFEKTNLYTKIQKRGRKKSYDTYVCKDCGLKGKRYGLDEYVEATERDCALPPNYPKRVKTISRSVEGVSLEDNTEYKTVPPPFEWKHLSGVFSRKE